MNKDQENSTLLNDDSAQTSEVVTAGGTALVRTSENREATQDTEELTKGSKSKFKHLAPVNSADIDKGYRAALSFAIDEDDVRNIGLSGPYSSGKSSVIATFEANDPSRQYLNISLASFSEPLSEGEGSANGKQDRLQPKEMERIERGILQQMLYSAPTNSLPYSRLKRIATPEYAFPKAFALAVWTTIVVYIANDWSDFTYIDAGRPFDISKLVMFALAFAGLTAILTQLYRASFGHSLKKLSLKNAEIETHAPGEGSILNHHLDEIVYFFEETDFKVVVFEDLDRFRSPEIFVKLREINKLINAQRKDVDPVKFIYAVRDDIFSDKNRAKFFDVIIPIIPVVNFSNSLDKMREGVSEADISAKIDDEFLRGVSLFIDDLRLIHNIFNEFIVYLERIQSPKLDATKLLAIIIYKNVYPNDFEALHHRRGAFHSVCAARGDCISTIKAKLIDRVEQIEHLIASSEDEEAASIDELVKVYLAQIFSHVPEKMGFYRFITEEEEFSYQDSLELEKFNLLVGAEDIIIGNQPNPHPSHQHSLGVSFEDIEKEIDARRSFDDRKRNVENRAEDKRLKLRQEISHIESEMAAITKLPFSDILRKSNFSYDDVLEANQLKNADLLIYLITNGYLDDNYLQYTSSFHEGGRRTAADRDFLINIVNFGDPEPDHQLDNPEEVCRMMRKEDFRSRHALNLSLLNYLLTVPEEMADELKGIAAYSAQHFDRAERFITLYCREGEHPVVLLELIVSEWSSYVDVVASDEKYSAHLRILMASSKSEVIANALKSSVNASKFVSEKPKLLFSNSPPGEAELNLIGDLNVSFADLSQLEGLSDLQELAIKNRLFPLNAENVHHAYNLATENKIKEYDRVSYTDIVQLESGPLAEYVDAEIQTFVEGVLLSTEGMQPEDKDATITLLNDERIQISDREEIVAGQEHIYMTLSEIPSPLWDCVVEHDRVRLTWLDLSNVLSEHSAGRELATRALSTPEIVSCLLEHRTQVDDLSEDQAQSVSDFLFDNDQLDDTDYCSLMQCLDYTYDNFPDDMSENKLRCLITNQIVSLTAESFEFVGSRDSLKAKLIASNFDSFSANSDLFLIDDATREALLKEEMEHRSRIEVIENMSWQTISENKNLMGIVQSLLRSPETQLDEFENTEILMGVIKTASDEAYSVDLLIRSISRWTESEAMEALMSLGYPYSTIAKYGRRPRISAIELNAMLAAALKRRGFISSFSSSRFGIRINTKKVPGAS